MADHKHSHPRIAFIIDVIHRIPIGVRRVFFTGILRFFFALSLKHRLIAIHNLRLAFPEKSFSEIRRIARGVYRNIGIVMAEFFDIPYLTEENIRQRITVEGLEHCREALRKNRGLLMFGAHFGNWELEAAAFAHLFQPIVAIYRPLDSAFLDHLVLQVRSLGGNMAVAKERAMRPMLRHLKNNDILGILIDQNMAVYEGVFVDFFGRTACTTDGLAHLALHTEAPVLPGYMARLPDGKYHFVIGEEVPIVRTGDRNADIIVNTQNFTRIIENVIRRYPDQWLWVHQRWKTQPWQTK
ncbi:MAG: lysophospholipid acyltransferase family protein [Syntrophales bacterium]|jgi:KDO2-lipid IV(A) lauroyltransferase